MATGTQNLTSDKARVLSTQPGTSKIWRGDNTWSNLLLAEQMSLDLKSTSASAWTALHLYTSADNGATIYINGSTRNADGENNMLTIRNNIGDLRLDDSTVNTGNLTVGQSTINTSYKFYVNGTSYLNGATSINDHLYLGAGKNIYMKYNNADYDIIINYNNGNTGMNAAGLGLYLGHSHTPATYIYYTNADSTTRTKFFEVNSNGAYAPTRFGVNGQNTSYNFYVNGTANITNTLYLTRTTDAEGTADNKPALMIGSPTGAHLEFDGNEIMAKASATTTSGLYLNNNGGTVYFGDRVDIPNHLIVSTKTSGNAYTEGGSAIQIREVARVGNAQSAWTYAPKIGFHWSGRVAAQIGLDSNQWICLYENNSTTPGKMRLHNIILEGATNATMSASSANPRITFQEGTGTQPVHLLYTDYDGYRSPAGLKVIGGADATPAWFEVEGDLYCRHGIGVSSSSSWIDGQRYNQAGWNLTNATNTGSYWPWMRQTNTGSGRWFSFGNLNNQMYLISSATGRTDNGYDRGWVWYGNDGHMVLEGGTYHQMIQMNTSNSECSIAYNGKSGETNWVSGVHGGYFGWWNGSYWVMDCHPVGRLWVGRNANDGERQIGVNHSNSGTIYLWANEGEKGIFSGSGFSTGYVIQINSSGKHFYGTDMNLTGNLTVSSGNTTGGGIILADDGDIVDLNDGYCAMRFSAGVRIFSGNRGGSAVITLGNNGKVTCGGVDSNGPLNMNSGNVLSFGSDGNNDQGDIIWWHNNGRESARLWTAQGFTQAAGPYWRCYNTSGTLLISGNITVSSGSSRYIKHNIHSLSENEAIKVLQLNPVFFEYNTGCGPSGVRTGMIAEEVLPIMPQVTYDFPVYEDSTNVSTPTRVVKAINYELVLPYVIKLVQMQQKEIENLKQTINQLQNNL